VLTLCAQVAPLLKPHSGWITEIRWGSYEIAGKKSPIKGLMVTRSRRR
jgi:hypothetical protein